MNAELQDCSQELGTLVPGCKASLAAGKLNEVRTLLLRGRDVLRNLRIELRCAGQDRTSEWKDKCKTCERELGAIAAELAVQEKKTLKPTSATSEECLTKAAATQQQSLEAAKAMDDLLTGTVELGTATAEKLHQNNEVMAHAAAQVREIESDAHLAKKQVRTLSRRIVAGKFF